MAGGKDTEHLQGRRRRRKGSREGQQQGPTKAKSPRGRLRDSDGLQGGEGHTDGLPRLGEKRRCEEQAGNQRPTCTLWTSSDRGQGGLRARDPPPTEGRAQRPQSNRPEVVSCTNCPLSSLSATPASSLLSDTEEESTEDDDSDGTSHTAPVRPSHLHLLGFLSPLSIAPPPSSFPFPCFEDTHPGGPSLRQALRRRVGMLHEIPGQPSSPSSETTLPPRR